MTRGNKPKPHGCPPGGCDWRPNRGPRLHQAWKGAVSLLDDGQWHAKPDIASAMLAISDVDPGTCETIVREARQHDILEVRYVDRRAQYRLTAEGRQRLDQLDDSLMLPPQADDVEPFELVTVDLDGLAAARGVSVVEVRRHLAELEACGFVRRVGAAHGGLTLALTLPAAG